MMKVSLTSILSVIFIAFIFHSIWNLISIFRAPTCKNNEVCYNSFLNFKPSLELLVYLTDNSKTSDTKLIYHSKNFEYEKPLERKITINLSPTVRNNGTLYIHTVVIPTRKSERNISLNEAVRLNEATYLKNRLTQFAVPKSSTFNLLKDENKTQSYKPISHLKSKFAIMMCVEILNIPHNNLPAEIIRHLRFNNKRQFLPILQQDFLQTRLKDLLEIEQDMKNAEFTFTYTPSSFGKLRFLLQIESTLTQFLTLGFTHKDLDEIKGVFADTNLYLLCATVFIGSVHLLFDFLSFKSDVNFWRSHRSMAGLSTRTVLWRAFSQTVVFFYLLDEGTSLLVLIPSGVGTVIEFWKVKKVFKVSISWESGLPRLTFNKDRVETAEEAKTREYDEECMRYLSYVLYPLCLGAAVYSLIYQPHKSWYSWTINSLVNGVYAFGFLFMLPQLFVNYRLKSVAALPWKAFTYRAFNTFIDDIFAFIITMPMAHRVACFRDDVVFIIYLYQRWLYPVDKSRTDDMEETPQTTKDKKTK